MSSANGQLSGNAKVVREPKSDVDMVIPCEVKIYFETCRGHRKGSFRLKLV